MSAQVHTPVEPCPVCQGHVITLPDPDSTAKRPIRDMTYCTACATIFSPWTMPAHRERAAA